MGRGNAQERAAQARAKLAAASQEQAEIAKQALDAVDNGFDPKVAAALALAATASGSIETPVLAEPAKPAPPPVPVVLKKIRMYRNFEGVPFSTSVFVGGRQFFVDVDTNGVAEVDATAANFLIQEGFDFELVTE